MHAIILAAGRGSRLAGHNPDARPKCLMEFGGRSLLARHLELLQQQRVQRVDLVVGYEADQVIEHVAELMVRPEVAFHFNPRFLQGSVISLLAARASTKTRASRDGSASRWGWRILTATVRSRSACSARYTHATPPEPICSRRT